MSQDSNATPKKTTEEVIEDFNRTHNLPINITDTVTHTEFVHGVKAGKIGFKSIGEPNQLLRGASKAVFTLFAIFYTALPLLLIPTWSYIQTNWWLLLGIPISYLGAFSAASRSKLIYLFLLFCLWNWFKHGFDIQQFTTFYFLCAFWGYVFFNAAEGFQRSSALKALLVDPDLFSNAIADKRIIIIKKREPLS
jgi:hypothetical protein